jgi:hypothetical protein
MKKLLKEPLIHFLVIGAALFLVFDLPGVRSVRRYEYAEHG